MSAAPSPTPTNGGSRSRDPRVDHAISWALTTFAAAAFTYGGWAFTMLTGEVKAMRSDMAAITTRIAIVESARYSEQIKEIEARLRAVERGSVR